jgi:hypothetical protein
MMIYIIFLWISGWWYFSKLRERIELLEMQVMLLSTPKNEQEKESEEWTIG